MHKNEEKSPKRHLSRLGQQKRLAITIVTLIFGVVGSVLLVRSFAAGTFQIVEPESGARSGNQTVVNDPGVSGTGAVQFGGSGSSSSALLQPDSLGFAPYAYISWGDVTMDNIRSSTGVKNFVAAFIQSAGGCTPGWDGQSSNGLQSSRSTTIANDINAVRSHGGDVMISLGGAGGTDLAVSCTSVSSLKSAYQSIVDRFGLTRLDFDVEGSAANDSAANTRRAQALAQLQAQNPGLKVWFTLAVETSGLSATGRGILQGLRDNGVKVSGINIMIMDYGTNNSNMGQAGIQAANSTFTQVKALHSSLSDTVVWKTIGLIPMIGVNDTQPETFTLANAQTVRDFADQKGLGMLSMWSANRDKSCPGGNGELSGTCSGVSQSQYQFSSILNMPSH